MDYRRIGLLRDSSTALRSTYLEGIVGPSHSWAVRTSLFNACNTDYTTSFHYKFFLLAFFLSFFALFQSC